MEKIYADIAVVGAGPAGLCASVAAAEEGFQVVCFEKSGVPGGAANMGMGPFGVESRLQKAEMGTLTKEEAFTRFMDYVHWQSDANLIHDYLWNSGPTIDWLEDMGVVFAGAMKNFPQSEATWHVVQPEDGGRPGPRCASAMNKTIFERGQELGVQYFFETPVKSLHCEDKIITGLTAVDKDGVEYDVECDAVIICTGGFGTNPEMVKQYTGYTLEKDMFDFMIPGIDGDGIRMAWEIGAGKGRMEMERTGKTPLPDSIAMAHEQCRVFNNAGAIAVNLNGLRVANENILQNHSINGNICDYQPERTMFRILSSDAVEYYRVHGNDFVGKVHNVGNVEDFQPGWHQLCEDHPTICYEANSPEELAEKIGMPADEFAKTIERYNYNCEMHFDDDFCKPRQHLIPLTGKEYYALKIMPSAYGSLGGIKINHKLQVLTEDREWIEGLYGAGTDVNEMYNGTYFYYFPGNTMGFAVTTGRMAGQYAAAFLRELEEQMDEE